MPHWEINGVDDIIGVCVIAGMALLTVAVVVLNRKIKLRKGSGVDSETVEITSKDDRGEPVNTKTTTTHASRPASCDDYQADHLALMKELSTAVLEIKQVILGVDAMQKAETNALCVLLGLAEGDEINGQVKAAKTALLQAQGYKQATEEIGHTS